MPHLDVFSSHFSSGGMVQGALLALFDPGGASGRVSRDVPSRIPDSIPWATPSRAPCVLLECVAGKQRVKSEEVKL